MFARVIAHSNHIGLSTIVVLAVAGLNLINTGAVGIMEALFLMIFHVLIDSSSKYHNYGYIVDISAHTAYTARKADCSFTFLDVSCGSSLACIRV